MSNFFKHKFRSKSLGEIVGMIIFIIIGAVGLVILFGFGIMWLWNWLMPEIFGLTTLNYWQAIGIFILFKILLGGCAFGGNSSKKSDCKKESKGEFSKWKHYDKFWKEQGNEAYEAYLERLNAENNKDD